jgi:hypothetical protein
MFGKGHRASEHFFWTRRLAGFLRQLSPQPKRQDGRTQAEQRNGSHQAKYKTPDRTADHPHPVHGDGDGLARRCSFHSEHFTILVSPVGKEAL